MTKHEKFYCILGLMWILLMLSIHILSQFRFLNSEIETTQADLVSHQTRPRVLNGILITPQMARIIQCESGFNQYKLGDQGRAIGLAQFHEDTFLMFQKQSGIKGNIFDAYTQLKVMAWALDNKKEYHWTCK